MNNKKPKLIFVDVRKCGFAAEPRYYWWGWSKSPVILARKSAAEALLKAKSFLPKGYNFKIWDCKRTRKIQMIMQESFKRRLQLAYPTASKKKIIKLVELFSGPYPPPPIPTRPYGHGMGGAFDLTIVDNESRELYMGTDHDDLTKKAATDYFEKKKNLTALEKEAKKNRKLLIKAIKEAGFKNYAPEWWHWGYEE